MNAKRALLGAAVAVACGRAGYLAASPNPVQVPDAMVARFAGAWAGGDTPTPFGHIDFALDFVWQDDGSLRAFTPLSRETWVELRFQKDAGGTWLLHESASLAGLGVQGYTMHPVRLAADTLHYAYMKDPKFLSCEMAVTDRGLYMAVIVREEEHVRFLLARIEGEDAAALRRDLADTATRSGADDIEKLRQTGASTDPVEIGNARAKARIRPEDPQAQLELARSLGAHIDAVPLQTRALYAQEMLAALERAVRLDPSFADARYGLAQYYLQAPPIAGGSVEAAEAQAVALAGLGSPLGEVVRAQIEYRNGAHEAATQRLRAVVDAHPELESARRLYLRYSGEHGSTP